MPVVVTLRPGTDRQAVCQRRTGVQLSACLLAVGFCAVTLAGCERAWHSSTGAGSAKAYAVSNTAKPSTVSSTARAHAVSNPPRAHAVSSPARAHAASSTAKADAATSGTANGSVGSSVGSRSPIPLPDPALLREQSEPDCEFKAAEAKTDERMKLDYERQCYRHAEMIVRNRLELLQSSVEKTIKAVKRGEGGGS
jgi:hypothetical protein